MKTAKVLIIFVILILGSFVLTYHAECKAEIGGFYVGDGRANPQRIEIAKFETFIAYSNGTVLDTRTGLMWAAKDNGDDISWYEAKKYCEKYRAGGYKDWRMPTQEELAGIYDACKQNLHGFHVVSFIDITASCPWASETRDSYAASYFFYTFGVRCWLPKYTTFLNRALPVRVWK